MRRAGALLMAVAMVAAAFVVRDRIAGDDADTDGPGSDRIVCPTELADVCRAAGPAVTTEPAGATADRLVAAEDDDALGASAWIVPATWARLVLAERARLGREALFEISAPIATTPVLRIAWADTRAQLADACGVPDPDWRCIAEQSASRRVRAGAPPVDSATGLSVAAAQVAELLARPDFATNDFDPSFRALAASLAAGQTDDPLTTMRARGPGELGVVGVVAADARILTTTFGELVQEDEPARADLVVLAPIGAVPPSVDAIGAAFDDAGWDPPVDAPDGLPTDGSVLAAVRTFWKENQR